jgi:hypothetical protein
MRIARHVYNRALVLMLAGAACGGTSSPAVTGHAGAMGGAAGKTGAGGATSAGAGGATSAGAGGATSAGAGGATGAGGRGQTGRAGMGGVVTCTPGVQETLITDCGYPAAAGSPLAAVAFSEDEVLRAIEGVGGAPSGIVRMFYNDEHAMTLGVRSVAVKTAAGTTMTDFPVTALATDPGSAIDPKTGTNDLIGDNCGLDQSLRPMWPVLFITDLTANVQSRAGDWQQGGRPLGPNAVFGSWKAALRTVDKTVTPNKVTITPDADPAKNKWDLAGGDPVPAGLTDQGFGAEARWNVMLTPGHSYRLQVIVHDGDQNKAGGDSGEACVLFCAGTGGEGAGGSGGTYPPPVVCPAGTTACSTDDVNPTAACAAGTVCANGCCLPYVP